MAFYQSDYAKGTIDLPVPECAGQVVTHRLEYSWPAAGLSANDIIEFGVVPSNLRVVDMTLISDDLDTNGTPTIVLDVGILDGTWQDNDSSRTTIGDEFFDGATVAQAGGVVRMSEADGFELAKSASDRSIGIKVMTAAATSAAGTITLIAQFASE